MHEAKVIPETTIRDLDNAVADEKGSQQSSSVLDNHEHVVGGFQRGVQNIEAITLTWTTTSLIVAFCLIWLVYFIQGLIAGTNGSLVPYITSDFAAHSLTATTAVMSSVISGVTNLTIAKIMDVFGRPHGFFTCVVLATLGLIMSAACTNIEAYAASQVFYTVGINGVGYSMTVLIADLTTLRNRALVQTLCASGQIITAWLGGPISTAFLNGAGWRWALGMESILLPSITLPLLGLFMHYYLKAKRQGVVPQRISQPTILKSLSYYAQEFDVMGLLLVSAGIAFLLLPFNLYAMQAKSWSSPLIIIFLVLAVVFLIAAGIWETYFAKITFVPWKLMSDRMVAGACLLGFALFLSNMCWGLYLSSILQVNNNMSVTTASYVVQMYTVVGFGFAIGVGALISRTGIFKSITLYFAIPLTLLGAGLLIFFRQPNGHPGYIIMCQLFTSIGGGTIMITDEIAILAAVKEQQHFAMAIALVSMFSSIGSAVGLTLSAAIWQDIFPKSLVMYLPDEEHEHLMMIYSDLTMQLSYEIGSPTRLAIQQAYGEGQKYLYTAATASLALAVVAVLMWRNTNVKEVKQTVGRVF